MDDCVEFAKRLRDAGAPTTLDVINSVPHGFLNFGKVFSQFLINVYCYFFKKFNQLYE